MFDIAGNDRQAVRYGDSGNFTVVFAETFCFGGHRFVNGLRVRIKGQNLEFRIIRHNFAQKLTARRHSRRVLRVVDQGESAAQRFLNDNNGNSYAFRRNRFNTCRQRPVPRLMMNIQRNRVGVEQITCLNHISHHLSDSVFGGTPERAARTHPIAARCQRSLSIGRVGDSELADI